MCLCACTVNVRKVLSHLQVVNDGEAYEEYEDDFEVIMHLIYQMGYRTGNKVLFFFRIISSPYLFSYLFFFLCLIFACFNRYVLRNW